MTPAKATIGVLGGMGPEATILFMQKMVAAVQADDDADHVPLIVHNNTQVPSRIKMLINGDGADPAPVLAEMARGLEQAGAEALAMPCNTAHVCAPAIVDAVSVPFLDMVELAAGKARDMAGSGARVGLLGSPALEQTDVFRQPLQRTRRRTGPLGSHSCGALGWLTRRPRLPPPRPTPPPAPLPP